MPNLCLANSLIIITICFNYVYLVIYYFLVMSDIRILKNAKNVTDLDKWALKYVKKYKFDKDIILGNLIKQIESGKKGIKIQKWSFLLVIIFVITHFTSRNPYTVHILWKTVHIGRDQLMILNGIMILCLFAGLFALLLFRLTHKRNIVAHEQFSRLL